MPYICQVSCSEEIHHKYYMQEMFSGGKLLVYFWRRLIGHHWKQQYRWLWSDLQEQLFHSYQWTVVSCPSALDQAESKRLKFIFYGNV